MRGMNQGGGQNGSPSTFTRSASITSLPVVDSAGISSSGFSRMGNGMTSVSQSVGNNGFGGVGSIPTSSAPLFRGPFNGNMGLNSVDLGNMGIGSLGGMPLMLNFGMGMMGTDNVGGVGFNGLTSNQGGFYGNNNHNGNGNLDDYIGSSYNANLIPMMSMMGGGAFANQLSSSLQPNLNLLFSGTSIPAGAAASTPSTSSSVIFNNAAAAITSPQQQQIQSLYPMSTTSSSSTSSAAINAMSPIGHPSHLSMNMIVPPQPSVITFTNHNHNINLHDSTSTMSSNTSSPATLIPSSSLLSSPVTSHSLPDAETLWSTGSNDVFSETATITMSPHSQQIPSLPLQQHHQHVQNQLSVHQHQPIAMTTTSSTSSACDTTLSLPMFYEASLMAGVSGSINSPGGNVNSTTRGGGQVGNGAGSGIGDLQLDLDEFGVDELGLGIGIGLGPGGVSNGGGGGVLKHEEEDGVSSDDEVVLLDPWKFSGERDIKVNIGSVNNISSSLTLQKSYAVSGGGQKTSSSGGGGGKCRVKKSGKKRHQPFSNGPARSVLHAAPTTATDTTVREIRPKQTAKTVVSVLPNPTTTTLKIPNNTKPYQSSNGLKSTSSASSSKPSSLRPPTPAATPSPSSPPKKSPFESSSVIPLPTSTIISPDLTTCTNCKTTATSLWRRTREGLPLCNACGLFQKLHGRDRPQSMKAEVVKRRRRARGTGGAGGGGSSSNGGRAKGAGGAGNAVGGSSASASSGVKAGKSGSAGVRKK
ncbi:hypothetical protein HDU76_004410 [Blyttiomyces sp. JEL0837]|nr:hypothetical protein HDU76_004410 [Blyttiomyces sp. JEL0837]